MADLIIYSYAEVPKWVNSGLSLLKDCLKVDSILVLKKNTLNAKVSVQT